MVQQTGSTSAKDIHIDRNEKEDHRRVESCPESTTSELVTVSMTQEIKMKLPIWQQEAYEGLLT